MGGLATGTGNKRAAFRDRGNDLYQTPPVAVRALLSVEPLPERIWEPCCGPGAIVRELRMAGHKVFGSDLVDYDSPDQDAVQWDFLFERELPMVGAKPVQAIVTNPPFKNAEQFVAHALTLVPTVAMLLRLAFLESEKRRAILDEAPLARVHVFRKRLPMMHRDGWQGKKANSGMAFAWFVWERGHDGPVELSRLSWEPFDSGNQAGA